MFPIFMGTKLPLGLFAGLRVDNLDGYSCSVSLPYGWRSQNPFRSIYFAAQAMAAELSTGALAMLACQSSNSSIAMLITHMEADFIKKANKRTTFICSQGAELFDTVYQAANSSEAHELTVESNGTMPDGTVVSTFRFTWSFKKRSGKH